jgi:hypothetical protein
MLLTVELLILLPFSTYRSHHTKSAIPVNHIDCAHLSLAYVFFLVFPSFLSFLLDLISVGYNRIFKQK